MKEVLKCDPVCGRCRKAYDPADDRWLLVPGAGIYTGSAPLDETMDVRDRLMAAEPGAEVRGIEPSDEDEIVIDGVLHSIVGLLCPSCRQEVDGE